MRLFQPVVAAMVVASVVVAAEAAAQIDVPAVGQDSEKIRDSSPRYAPFRWSPVPAREKVMTYPAVVDPSTSPPTDPRRRATPPTGLRRDSLPRYAPFRWSPVPAVRGGERGY